MKFVRKYLIPNEDNEYKPHLLRKTGLAFITAFAVAIFALGAFQTLVFHTTSFLSAVFPQVLVDLANQNRTDNQLATLTVSPTLEAIAQAKANDMATKSYFAHTNPDGKQFWVWFKESGYNYAYAGENLAVNFSDSAEVDTAWMNSPAHRANLLSGKFTEVGIATANGFYNGRPTIFVAQEFGRPMSSAQVVKIAPKKVPKLTVATSTQTALSGTSTSTPTTTSVLGEEVQAPRVLAESTTFVAVQNTQNPELISDSAPSSAPEKTNRVATLATEPKSFGNLYLALAAVLVLALALCIGVEVNRQHPKNVIAGMLLLFLILILFYLYQTVLFGQVIVT